MNRRPNISPWSALLVVLLFLCLVGVAAADDYVGGLPLTTVQTGTVTGGLYMNITPAPNWGAKDITKTFTLPAAAVAAPGRIKWARLYVSAYCGHMQNDYAFQMTTKFDGDGVSGYEKTWAETGHAMFHYQIAQDDGIVGNDNRALGGGEHDPYLMINDHETRVTSDYFATYDVTNLITSQTVNTEVITTGSYDGRIKVLSLVVAYDDPASTTQTTYWVNQGHDVCSYYTEQSGGTVNGDLHVALGTTTFATTGLSGITSAKLYIDYMASNNGFYGFPTAENTFSVDEETNAVSGTFTNNLLDRVPDNQNSYSGVDSWDVTSSVTGASDVTFGYARYFPAGTGLSGFYKLPLALLVVTKPLAVPAPVADFSGTPTSGNAPLTVAFSDTSTNTPTGWAWTISGVQGTDYQYVDGTTAASQNPHVKFLNPGSYDVSLTATNAGGSNTKTQNGYITVTAPPVPTIAVTLDSSSVSLANMVRGQDATGSTGVHVAASNGASWSVTASDGKTTNKGYMVNGATPLLNPFQLGNNGAAYQPLTSDYTSFMSGSSMGSFSATASLKQSVATGDGTGTYGITVTFTGAIS